MSWSLIRVPNSRRQSRTLRTIGLAWWRVRTRLRYVGSSALGLPRSKWRELLFPGMLPSGNPSEGMPTILLML